MRPKFIGSGLGGLLIILILAALSCASQTAGASLPPRRGAAPPAAAAPLDTPTPTPFPTPAYGPAWRQASIPNVGGGPLQDVTVINYNDAWAVGESLNNPLTLHWNGRQWDPVPLPTPGTGMLLGVDGL